MTAAPAAHLPYLAMAEPTPDPAVVPVTAVLLVARIDDRLVDALEAVAAQTTRPDRLLILDATAAGDLAGHLGPDSALATRLPSHRIQRVAPGTGLHAALAAACESTGEPGKQGALWALTGETVPDATALAELHTVLAADPAVGVAAPKLADADRPGRLTRFGIQVTRSGRLQLDPRPGDPDQQQFDDRTDALAAPAEGMLVRRAAYGALGGHLSSFGALGTDLDFGWRAHQAGYRVALAPRARVALAPHVLPLPSTADRRDARRVALARRPLLLMPFLTVWTAVSTLAVALGLLALKRPAAAARQAGEAAAVLDPWRPLLARWRTRGQRVKQPASTRGLFVTAAASRARASDRLHDVVVPQRSSGSTALRPADNVLDPGPALLAAPAIWGTLLVAALTGVAARTLTSGVGAGLIRGWQGGELSRPFDADSTSLWHAWWDGWAGPGLGAATPASPGVAGLAVLSWITQHLPGAGDNPAGRTIALGMVLALPLAFLSAYLSAHVVTPARWPRALAAAIWALSPAATGALAAGRLGALAILVLLPLMLAGFVRMARPTARPGSLALAALTTTALALVVPGAVVLGAGVALGLLLAGYAVARRRAVGYLLVLALAAIPVLLLVRDTPAALLGGWGLVAHGDSPPLWQIALGQPDVLPADGTALAALSDPRRWLLVPVLAAGLLGVVRPRLRGGLPGAALALALTGLALALVAPRVVLGATSGGVPVHPWAGTGLLLMLAGLLGAALCAAPPAPTVWSRPLAVCAGAGALALAVNLAVGGLGARLVPATDPRPAVAIDQASGPDATRTLRLLERGAGFGYEFIGAEPGIPARDIATPAPSRALDDLVATLLDPAAGGTADPAGLLAQQAIGFVIVAPGLPASLERQLDATSGLTRIGDYQQQAVWRVEPAAAGARAQPARLRLAAGDGWGDPVAVRGSHGATSATISAPDGARLLVAEPAGWADHARVSADGVRLAGETTPSGVQSYAVPAGAEELRVIVRPHHRVLGWAYLAALLFIGYLALPLGAAPARRTRDPHLQERAG
ncbi:MAG TPA: hypothetical protein P5314_04030 [Tetrasphaera sp.]|nr:hypothetical protein [Tetrasphaera sp.]